MGPLNYAIILTSVVFLGLFGGTVFAMLLHAAQADAPEVVEQDLATVLSERRGRIIELAEQVEDRNHYITELTHWAELVSEDYPDVIPPAVPEWWCEDEHG